MEKLKRTGLAASVVTILFVMPLRHGVAGDLKLTVVIYDHAHLSDGKLAGVEGTASEVFQRAGVQLLWVEGFAYAAKRRSVLNPPPEDPASLVVKLQPQAEASQYGVRSECDGIGLDSGPIIFVRKFDPRSNVSDVTRIGYVIAHEIGHVLLGPNAHSIAGIMRGTLRQPDWENAAQSTLGFTQSQAQQIRTWIDERRASADAQTKVNIANQEYGHEPPSRAVPPESLNHATHDARIAPEVKLVVGLYDYAQIPRSVLTRAEEETAAVFQIAGIKLSWVECGPSGVHKESFLDCERVTDHRGIYVNIIPQRMTAGLPWAGKFGASFGNHAVIYQHRVEQAAHEECFSKALILGYVMAHELGHLLLGKGHGSGIMTDTFVRRDFLRGEKGELAFTPEQAELIRARILKSS